MADSSGEASELLRPLEPPEAEGAGRLGEPGGSGGRPSADGVGRAASRAALPLLLLLAALAAVLARSRLAGPALDASAAPAALAADYATYAGSGPFWCTGPAAALAAGQGDGTTWRCQGGACIDAASRCDGNYDCMDQSDESGCGSAGAALGAAGQAGAAGAPPGPAFVPVPSPVPVSVPAAAPAPAPAPPGSSSSNSVSFPLASSWQPAPPPEGAGGADCTERGGVQYQEVWSAQGPTFFDSFDYLLNDANSGAAQYLTKEAAMAQGVTSAYNSHAILRAGPKADHLKRASAKLVTKSKWTYFLLAAKFNHVPWGCGVWPAFWTKSPEAAWPNGGELDILEYSNEIASRSSFHVGLANKCQLDASLLRKPGCPQFVDAEFNFTGDYQCVTHYPDMIGCAPNRLPLRSGEQLAAAPFVAVAEWTPAYLKLFHIPAAEAPADLAAGQPRPDEWERWLTAYYPMAASERRRPGSCPNPERVLKAQQLVLSLGFCGDWASKVWLNSTCANTQGQGKGPALPSQCVAVDPHNPMGEVPGGPRDCCTAFIHDEYGQYGADAYLAERAYFNISWIRVFQQSSRRLGGGRRGRSGWAA